MRANLQGHLAIQTTKIKWWLGKAAQIASLKELEGCGGLVQGTLWPVNMDEPAGAGKAPAKSKPDPDTTMLQKNLVPTMQSALACRPGRSPE